MRRSRVLFADLDDFKAATTLAATPTATGCCEEVARRLSSCLRSADTAARLGGDEFGVLHRGRHRPGGRDPHRRADPRGPHATVRPRRRAVAVSASIGPGDQRRRRPRGRGAAPQGRPRDVRGQAQRQAPRRALPARVWSARTPRRRSRAPLVRAQRRAARGDPGRARGPRRHHDGVPADHGSAHRPRAGYESLSRFNRAPRRAPDAWFAQAHRCGLGYALEAKAHRRRARDARTRPRRHVPDGQPQPVLAARQTRSCASSLAPG